MKYLITIFFIACFTLQGKSVENLDAVESKVDFLSSRTVVKYGYIGRARVYPEELKALWVIAKDPKSEEYFFKMTEKQNDYAKLYGLMGLKVIKSNKYDAVKTKLGKNNSNITFFEGCVASTHSVSKMAEMITKKDIPTPPKDK